MMTKILILNQILTVITTIMMICIKWLPYWLRVSRRWSTETSRKGEDFPEKVPVPQTLIRGTTEEILIGKKLDLENLTSQKRDVTTVMELDTLQLIAENPELRRNKV